MVAIAVGAVCLGPMTGVMFSGPVLQLLGAAAGTTGTLGAVAEGAIVGAGVVAGGTAAVAEAAVTDRSRLRLGSGNHS